MSEPEPDDDRSGHIHGPTLDQDGFLVGEIALPGGLPPDEDEEEDDDARLGAPRWDEAWSIADRDGFVLYDPDTPGGFRALTPAERAELTDSVRAATSTELVWNRAAEPDAADSEISAEVAGPRLTPGGGQVDPRVSAHEVPGVNSEEGIAARERWALENADPAKAADDTHPDDLNRLEQRLDDLRLQLSGYTWREGVEREQALAERREQLERWNDYDRVGEQAYATGDTEASEDSDGILPHCLIYPDDPERYR